MPHSSLSLLDNHSVHCCKNYVLNILKRIGLGLLCCLLKEVIKITIHANSSIIFFDAVSDTFIANVTTCEVFHEVKAFLIFLSLMLYLCVSRQYRYRLRDEVVNEHFLMEEIYERQLTQTEEYEREHNISDSNSDYGSLNK